MELKRVLIREDDDTHVVELREKTGGRVFPIMIGFNEAAAIERRVMGHTPPRPQTHDLMGNVIAALAGQVERVVINQVKTDELGHGTFYAMLHIRQSGQLHQIDCRPSDAIALAVGLDVPIFVEEDVLELVSKSEPE
jgi:bifunctional DNase/RNase